MNCKEVKELLPDFVRRTLSDDERQLVSEHTSFCPACRREVEDLAGLMSRLSSRVVESPPVGYWNTVLPRIHERLDGRESRAWLPDLLKPVLPVSVAVMLIAIGLSIHPLTAVKDSQEVHALVHQLTSDELSQLDEEDEVSADDEGAEMQSTDTDVLRSMALDGDNIDYYSEFDPDIGTGSVSDQDADELVTRLAHEDIIN